MANTYTTNYNLTKPEVGGDTNQWGGHLNDNMDGIDTQMKSTATAVVAAQATADAALPKAGGTMTGALTLAGAPSSSLHAATKAYVDTFLPKSGGSLTGEVFLAAQPTDLSADLSVSTVKYVKDKVAQAEIAAGAGLPLTGGTMTGYLFLNADPINALGAAPKQYVDAGVASATAVANAALPKVGGTLTGPLILQTAAPTADYHAAPKIYVDGFVPKSGGTMTGSLILNDVPTNANGAATKSYCDTNFLGKTGNQSLAAGATLSLASDPTQALHAATKQYVDGYSVPKTGGSFSGALTVPSLTVTNGITCATLTASSDITLSSDVRIKDDIRTIDHALDLVTQLRGVSYVRKDTKKASVGVIAQEVEQIIPALVFTDESGMKSVAYANMVGVLIEAVKELTNRVKELEAR